MTKTEMLMAKSMGAGRSLNRKDKMNDDQISRQAAIDLWEKYHPTIAVDAMQYDAELRQLPSAQPDGWLEQNKDKILQAGMEGREIDFRIGGRLFAIREKAQ